MATTCNFIHLDMDLNIFVEEERTAPFHVPLYQSAKGPSTCYKDEDLNVTVHLVQPRELHTSVDEGKYYNNTTGSHSRSSMLLNCCFAKVNKKNAVDGGCRTLQADFQPR
ncbi:hypothetical protein ILYODFUR_030647 [Ilyodon furcidens]|uniref:Uncharacterized protein n=1 Tax=Ilyodon furcidens TaxID=33524 RepID=A0ABV0V7G1_9TELE